MSTLFYDIETSNLNPRAGFIFCFGGFDSVGDAKVIQGPERSILQAASQWVEASETIVSFSGSRFDVPFMNYRLAVHKLPRLVVNNHIDVQKLLPRQERGRPASLEKSCKAYGIDAKQTPFNEALWERARLGDSQALQDIAQHCREDVVSLRALYLAIKGADMSDVPKEVVSEPIEEIEDIERAENEGMVNDFYHLPPVKPWAENFMKYCPNDGAMYWKGTCIECGAKDVD